MTEGVKRVSAVARVEIITGGDGVLSAVGRVALTPGQRVHGVVVVSHQLHHGGQVRHTRGVPVGKYIKLGQMIVKARIDLANMRALGVLSYENQSPYSSTSSEFPLLLKTSG